MTIDEAKILLRQYFEEACEILDVDNKRYFSPTTISVQGIPSMRPSYPSPCIPI